MSLLASAFSNVNATESAAMLMTESKNCVALNRSMLVMAKLPFSLWHQARSVISGSGHHAFSHDSVMTDPSGRRAE
jgi:hypothetical protein